MPIAHAVERVVSGGQTGVDRAALEVAIAAGVPCGGWCPRGRRAEDGVIPLRYPLCETPSAGYPQRTGWNVRDSDATLVVTRGRPRGGTALTVRLATAARRPLLIVDLDEGASPTEVVTWLVSQRVRVLNVAGPRESDCPGIGAAAARLLGQVFAPVRLRARAQEPGSDPR